MEIIASIASITQLSRYALSLMFKISRVYSDIQDGAALQDKRIRELTQPFLMIQSLHKSSALKTSSIKEH